MKTKNLIAAIIVAVLFMASYTLNAQTAKNDAGNGPADSSMSNHNHSGGAMMNNSGSSMMNQGDSTMMNHGDKMAMMKQCQNMMQDMHKQMKENNCCAENEHATNKNDNSLTDPGTKKGSYGYFQYQREKAKKLDGDN